VGDLLRRQSRILDVLTPWSTQYTISAEDLPPPSTVMFVISGVDNMLDDPKSSLDNFVEVSSTSLRYLSFAISERFGKDLHWTYRTRGIFG
jgi:hypothetical protein